MTGLNPSPPGGTSLATSAAGPTLSTRERVVDLLQAGFADDHLSIEEFERRVAVAYQAKTSTELDALVADLAPAAVAPDVPPRTRITAFFSNTERNGAMAIQHYLEVVSILGNVELDLSDTKFAPGLTVIAVSAVLGNVEITVPLGVRVECAGEAFFGNFECKTADILGYPADAERVVRITGHSVFASVQIDAQPSRMLRQPHDAPRRLT
jgi:hypothetical protein